MEIGVPGFMDPIETVGKVGPQSTNEAIIINIVTVTGKT